MLCDSSTPIVTEDGLSRKSEPCATAYLGSKETRDDPRAIYRLLGQQPRQEICRNGRSEETLLEIRASRSARRFQPSLENQPGSKHIADNHRQYRDNPNERLAVEEAFGLPPSKWDGFAILTFDSMEGARAVCQDPDFAQWAKEDEPAFCAWPNVSMRIAVVGAPHIAYQRQ